MKTAKSFHRLTVCAAALLLLTSVYGAARAASGNQSYADTIKVFKNAGESASFFSHSYAYAVFPTIAAGAVGVGGAHGTGRVYVGGKYVGDTSMTQITVGLQLGGKAYSEIVFFEDKRSLQDFQKGSFEFGADASAVAVTAAANATAGTSGATVGASATSHDATTRGTYQKGMAVFTVAKGGLMYAAAVGGQKFSYKAR